ncbi:hypothetical protein ACFL5G_03755 [Candidatus Margulisiibacteriota bacterium]
MNSNKNKRYLSAKTFAVNVRGTILLSKVDQVSATKMPLYNKLKYYQRILKKVVSESKEKPQDIERIVNQGLLFFVLKEAGYKPVLEVNEKLISNKAAEKKANGLLKAAKSTPIWYGSAVVEQVFEKAGITVKDMIYMSSDKLFKKLSKAENIDVNTRYQEILEAFDSLKASTGDLIEHVDFIDGKLEVGNRLEELIREKIRASSKLANELLIKIMLMNKDQDIKTLKLQEINSLLSLIQRIQVRMAKHGLTTDVVSMIKEIPRVIERIEAAVRQLQLLHNEIGQVLASIRGIRSEIANQQFVTAEV